MDILPGVGAMGAVPPAQRGVHKLGGGMYLRPDEVSIRDVMLQFTMTKQGPKVSEISADTGKAIREVPKREAIQMMQEMVASLRTSPSPKPQEATPTPPDGGLEA